MNRLYAYLFLLTSLVAAVIAAEPRVVCYYTNWSVYRPGTAKFNPQNINPYLCTHLIYSFGGFTKDNQLKPFDKYQDIEQGGYAKFTGLKTYNKDLKTMLAIGGWNEGSARFSPLAASAERRGQLVKNAVKFLRQNKFDGLDLDWEYPAFRDGGKPKDRENYAKLVQELSDEFKREHDKTGRPRLLLTMAVPAGFEYIEKGYDVAKLNKYLDWFNLLSYDYHSAYEPSVNHHAPLYPLEEDSEYNYDNELNINATIDFYLKAGADREKLVLGIPTYGRSYTLFNPESNELGAPADGPGEQGDATREKGYLAYYEICQNLNDKELDWTVVQPNPDAIGPYAYSGNQWVGYDDELIVRKKSEFVVQNRLGGIMFWSIDNDDFRGLCNNKPYPLIEAAKEAYLESLANGVTTTKSNSNRKQPVKVTTTTRRTDLKTSPKWTTPTPPPPITPDPGSDFKCEDEGFYPHPRDCKKYFWCLEAAGLGIVAHQFTCPSGLFFNKLADSCDYTRNVHCDLSSSKKSTTTTEEPTTTSTTARSTTARANVPLTTRTNPLYRSPSRATTTQRIYTTSEEPIFEPTDQEDPKVIKELIDLIKKAGGIEELERQLNINDDKGADHIVIKSKNQEAPSTINKTLYEKIKNRASVLKTRPAFNGASQPASQPERLTEKENAATATENTAVVAKKTYNSVNRFSRPSPQNDGIDQLPEHDSVIVEKPQYTSIRRRPGPGTKPPVIAENDYNREESDDEDDISRGAVTSSENDSSKKYASIQRTRRPQPVAEEVEEDEEDEDDEYEFPSRLVTTSTKPTSRYVNLSRRRTTAVPEVQEEDEPTTTIAPRRRFPEPVQQQQQQQQKTVLNHKQSYETISRKKNTDYTKQSTTPALTEDELDDDNVIALPTEPITENLPPPENILTTSTRVTTTLSPIQVNSLVQSELSSELLTTTESEFEATTLTNDFSDSSKLSESAKQTDEILSLIDISPRTESPRPFARPFVSRTRAPAIRNGGEDVSTTSTTVAASSRRRPSRVSTTRSSTTSAANSNDDDNETLSPRRTYSSAGGRGTARYRTKQTKSGDYDHVANRYEPIEDNRVRAINFDRANRINSIEKTSTTQAAASTSARRRPVVSRTQTTIKTTTPSTDEDDEESTTEEQRVIEQQSRFALKPNERPERISFTLGTGSRIEFNTPKLDQRNDTAAAKSKIITGPLASSPLAESSRDFKKGHVEEIPLAAKTNISVESHSDKLDLGEIPLNKSDIASFVPSEALTTSTQRVRLRPSKGGYAKSYSTAGTTTEESDESLTSAATTEAPEEDDEDIDTTTSRFRARPSKIGTTKAPIESADESSTQRTRFPPRSRVTVEQTRNEIDELSTISRRTTPTLSRFTRPSRPATESEAATTRSRDAASRLIGRNRVSQPTNSLDDSAIEESTTRKARVKITRINRLQATAADVNNLASDEEVRKSQIRPQAKVRPALRITTEEPNDNEANTENPFDGDDDETTQSIFDAIDDELTTLDTPVDVAAVEKPRKLPAKKVESFATRQTSTEAAEDESKAPKTTRRVVVTRRRPVVSTKEPAEESDVPKKSTTRRRVIARTRPRPQTTENTEQTSSSTESSSTDASTKERRVVTGRTRVFKRPVTTEKPAEIEEEKPKFVQLKKLVKVNKKTKAPKALGEPDLTADDFILKPEDLEQDIQNYNDEVQDEKVDEVVEDSVDVAPAVEDESSPAPRPGGRIATRPNAASRVTIKRRPIINIRPQTTLHPASTRTVKDSQSTRAKTVTIRRKFGSTGSTDGDVTPRKFTTLKTKKVYGGVRRVSTSSTTAPPNITPYNTETTDYEEVDDTTDTSSIDSSNDDDVNSQKSSSTRPRFSIKKSTRSTTMTPPTTLHHVFAIVEEANRNKSIDAENNASEVVKRTQKLIEISRIVEVYSKQDKLKLQKNNQLKTVKSTSLVVEKPPVLENFGEISRQTVIKVASSATSHNVTTHPETSTSSPEGVTSQVPASVDGLLTTSSIVRAPVVQLRPESNETKPIVISLESLDRVVLQKTSDDDDLTTSTVSYEDVTDLDEK